MRKSRLIQVAAVFVATAVAAVFAPLAAHAAAAAAPVAGPVAAEVSTVPMAPARPPLHTVATYKIEVGLEGEVFPAFANYASLQRPEDRRWGTIAVTITNSTGAPLRNPLPLKLPGCTDQEIQRPQTGAGEQRPSLF